MEEDGGFPLSLCLQGGESLQVGDGYRQRPNTYENWVKDWVGSEARTTPRSGRLPLHVDFRNPPPDPSDWPVRRQESEAPVSHSPRVNLADKGEGVKR